MLNCQAFSVLSPFLINSTEHSRRDDMQYVHANTSYTRVYLHCHIWENPLTFRELAVHVYISNIHTTDCKRFKRDLKLFHWIKQPIIIYVEITLMPEKSRNCRIPTLCISSILSTNTVNLRYLANLKANRQNNFYFSVSYDTGGQKKWFWFQSALAPTQILVKLGMHLFSELNCWSAY